MHMAKKKNDAQERTKVDDLRDVLAQRKEQEATAQEDDAPGEALAERIRKAEEEANEHHEKLLRVMAEFDNFRKRSARESTDAIAFGNERLLKEMMVVLDHLDEALGRVPSGDACPTEMQAFAEGIELTFRQFLSILKNFGFAEVPAEVGTPFDPSIHEGVGAVEGEEFAANHIVARQRRGYVLNGRLLRAAMVLVSK
jgi:molecular chaperone GrpE